MMDSLIKNDTTRHNQNQQQWNNGEGESTDVSEDDSSKSTTLSLTANITTNPQTPSTTAASHCTNHNSNSVSFVERATHQFVTQSHSNNQLQQQQQQTSQQQRRTGMTTTSSTVVIRTPSKASRMINTNVTESKINNKNSNTINPTSTPREKGKRGVRRSSIVVTEQEVDTNLSSPSRSSPSRSSPSRRKSVQRTKSSPSVATSRTKRSGGRRPLPISRVRVTNDNNNLPKAEVDHFIPTMIQRNGSIHSLESYSSSENVDAFYNNYKHKSSDQDVNDDENDDNDNRSHVMRLDVTFSSSRDRADSYDSYDEDGPLASPKNTTNNATTPSSASSTRRRGTRRRQPPSASKSFDSSYSSHSSHGGYNAPFYRSSNGQPTTPIRRRKRGVRFLLLLSNKHRAITNSTKTSPSKFMIGITSLFIVSFGIAFLISRYNHHHHYIYRQQPSSSSTLRDLSVLPNSTVLLLQQQQQNDLKRIRGSRIHQEQQNQLQYPRNSQFSTSSHREREYFVHNNISTTTTNVLNKKNYLRANKLYVPKVSNNTNRVVQFLNIFPNKYEIPKNYTKTAFADGMSKYSITAAQTPEITNMEKRNVKNTENHVNTQVDHNFHPNFYTMQELETLVSSKNTMNTSHFLLQNHPNTNVAPALRGGVAKNTFPVLTRSAVAAAPPSFSAGEIQFQEHMDDAPTCADIEPEDVTFTLVTQLSLNRLWMMEHHCMRWITSSTTHDDSLHPISIAVFIGNDTTMTNSHIVHDLENMGCPMEVITVQTVSGYSDAEYPVNKLRNVALSAVKTTHVVYIDIDFWTSIDLYETLRLHIDFFSTNPKGIVVLPAFQLQRQCREYKECPQKNIPKMPFNRNELIDLMMHRKATPFDPFNVGGHGSTRYKDWLDQSPDVLLPITCVNSNRYEPYTVFRYCRDVPPFQEIFTGYGKNKMTWIMQLRYMGYEFYQLGTSFVIHYPHLDSVARLKWNGGKDGTTLKKSDLLLKQQQQLGTNNVTSGTTVATTLDITELKRGQIDAAFVQFRNWLENTIQPKYEMKLKKCDPSQMKGKVAVLNDDEKLWVPPTTTTITN